MLQQSPDIYTGLWLASLEKRNESLGLLLAFIKMQFDESYHEAMAVIIL